MGKRTVTIGRTGRGGGADEPEAEVTLSAGGLTCGWDRDMTRIDWSRADP